MSSYDDFLPYVLTHVPGCPEIAATQALRETVIDFCTKSLIVQQTLTPISLTEGVADYVLSPPSGTLVVKVMHGYFNNRELEAVDPDRIPTATYYDSTVVGADQRGDPRMFSQKDPRSVTVIPVPLNNAANALRLRVALKPTRSASTIDDVLFEDWAEVIAAGARARLMIQPGKSYTNPPMFAAQNGLYLQGLNQARQQATRGYTRANLRVKMVKI